MGKVNDKDIVARIIAQAKNLGAAVAGIANVEALKNSPSYIFFEKFGSFDRLKPVDPGDSIPGEARPENVGSAVVIGVEHPADKPELDWWQDGFRGGTPGNRILMDINSRLSKWIEKELSYQTFKLPYHFENGGVFLKDAAVMASLGCIGKNNLFVSQIYGPRLRLRALLLAADLPASDGSDFNPCNGCDMPCRANCPQAAFQKRVYCVDELNPDKLPGRKGEYDRMLCNHQMETDISNCEKIRVPELDRTGKLINYCRLCEFTCPVGKV